LSVKIYHVFGSKQNRCFSSSGGKKNKKGSDDKETMKIILNVITSQERKVRKLTKK